MNKKNHILLICLLLIPNLSWGKSLFSDLAMDYTKATDCHNGQEIEEEFSKLFKVIKTEILGEKPKFCEAYKANTLNEQINSKNNEFDKFMAMLSNLPASKNKQDNLISLKDMDHKVLFFEVAKMMTIKKHWGYLNNDQRDKLLLNSSCSRLQINKFPLSDKKYNVGYIHSQGTKVLEKELEQTVEGICLSNTIELLAVFMDKDIVAETFLNLKKMFPQDYSKFTDYFCQEIITRPEALAINYNSNDIKATKDLIASSEHFSQWLNDSIKTISNKDQRDKNLAIINENSQKKIQEDNNNIMSFGFQAKYKTVYDSKKPGEKAIDPSNPDYEIVLNSKNIYISKKISNDYENSFKDKMNETSQKNFNIYLEKIDKNEINLEHVTFVKKGNEFSFKINKDKEADLLSSIEKSFSGNAESLKKKKEYELSPNGQIALEQIYKIYNNPADKDDLIYPGTENPVFINSEGKFEKKIDDYYSGEINKKSFEQYAAKIKPLKIGNYQVVPNEFNSFIIKSDEGKYTQAFLIKEDINQIVKSEAYSEEEDDDNFTQMNTAKPVVEFRNSLITNYQKADAVLSKMTTLSANEIAAIKSYTGSEFQSINSCMRKESCANLLVSKSQDLKNALSKLAQKDQSQVLYRGVASLPDDLMNKLNHQEKFIMDKGFMSTSGSYDVATSFSGFDSNGEKSGDSGIILMFKTKSCVGISAISYYETEDEFLCPPNLEFKAKRIENTNKYVLEEVEK